MKDFVTMWRTEKMDEALRKINDRVQYKSVPYPNSELRASEIRKEARTIRKEYMKVIVYCEDCGETDKRLLELHHIKPIALGGGNEVTNLRMLCPTCHKIQHLNYCQSRADLFTIAHQDLATGIKLKKVSENKVIYKNGTEDLSFELKTDGHYYMKINLEMEDNNYV